MVDENWIALDDAGGGNLMGGLVIAAVNHQTCESVSRVIGPEAFVPECDGSVKKRVAELTKEIVEAYGGNRLPLHICQSDLFDAASALLISEGWNVVRGGVDDVVGDYAEDLFIEHLMDLGLPGYLKSLRELIRREKDKGYRALNMFSANHLLIDREKRGDLCKKNSRLWRRLSEAELETEEVVIDHRKRAKAPLCYNCGRRIEEEQARRYRMDQKSVFYSHVICPQG